MRRGVWLAIAAAVSALAACEKAKEDANPEDVYKTTFAMARNDVHNLRGGGLVWQGHDVWLSFDAEARPILKSRIMLHAPAARELAGIAPRLGPCAELARRTGAQIGYYTDASRHVDNGRVLIYHAATTMVCYRDWDHG